MIIAMVVLPENMKAGSTGFLLAKFFVYKKNSNGNNIVDSLHIDRIVVCFKR